MPAGTDIIHPGQEDAELYTLFSGWAFRYKSLADGRRQILNFLLPGDLVGLQASLLSALGTWHRGVDRCRALHLSAQADLGSLRQDAEPGL